MGLNPSETGGLYTIKELSLTYGLPPEEARRKLTEYRSGVLPEQKDGKIWE